MDPFLGLISLLLTAIIITMKSRSLQVTTCKPQHNPHYAVASQVEPSTASPTLTVQPSEVSGFPARRKGYFVNLCFCQM